MDNNQNKPSNKRGRAYSKIDIAQKRAPAKNAGAAKKGANVNRNAQPQKKQGAAKKPTEASRQAQNQKSAAKKENRPAQNPAATGGDKRQPRRRTSSGRRAQQGVARQNANVPTLKITPLGGIEEIGKNITLFECEGDMILLDCGMGFPDSELFGIDVVIPDFTYAVENKDKIKALIVTHGHEDHIGGIPYLLKQMNVPVYGTKFTIGLIKGKLREHGLDNKANLNVITAGEALQFGCFSVEPLRVNHSIPDAVAFAIKTPAGTVVHTGDFKVDYTPVLDEVIDLRRFGELGSEGVLLLMADSTNAERPGSSTTESVVGESFERLFARAEGKRMIIASFASNVQRIQQIIDFAERHGRKVAISGRSMETYSEIAMNLGYLTIDDGVLIDIGDVHRHRPEDVIIITTGSQGEPMSALSRMANGTHKQISIGANDFVIISATPIPGNEMTVTKVINELMKLGSEVIYESMYDVHASGHACRDELKLMFSLIKPKYFVPVHGEYKHLVKNREIALSMGVRPQNVLIPAIGQTMEVSKQSIRYGGTVPSGRVLVDGLGVGDVGSLVLRDRKHLSEDGLMVVVCTLDSNTHELISGPDITSRGFVFVREAEPLMEEARETVRKIVDNIDVRRAKKDRSDLKIEIRDAVGKLMYQRTKRNPMILPVIMDI